MTKIIDGKQTAKSIREQIKAEVSNLKEKTGKIPGLAVVLIGENPASQSYVRGKIKACENTGIKSFSHKFPDGISEEDLLKLIDKLNKDDEIDGILVQLPLPKNINEEKIIEAIIPSKDVDGFHPKNVGLMWTDISNGFNPCTPAGIIELLKYYEIPTEGKHVVILGRSNIVGKPLAGLFLGRELNATVTVCHSRTKDITEFTKKADIVVSAIGKPNLVTKDMIKDGAVVIDVGINRVKSDKHEKGYCLCGDVDFENVKEKTSWITPVPGGVGPMTITMLLKNTLISFKRKIS